MTSLHAAVGCEVVMWYPASGQNRAAILPQLAARRVRVEEVRDLFRQPLSPEAVSERPDLLRSRYLCRCWDVRKQVYRSFYSGSARVVAAFPQGVSLRYEVAAVDEANLDVLHETDDLTVAGDIAERLRKLVGPLGVRTLVALRLAEDLPCGGM